jgi:HisJ family histidinol phosphate phosphatase
MPFSHHSHSGQFCKHGCGNLEDVVKEAIRQGFEVYALTEHVPRYRSEDLYPEEVRNLRFLAEEKYTLTLRKTWISASCQNSSAHF